ncbi:MAG: hypothetical protein M0P99_00295 [Candidatus Cloacimonetes bacterium]|nr:hypothetical protein [Candidatus Cloacimonadota bacterium]
MIQLFAKNQDTDTYQRLDLSKDEPIKLTFQAQDVEKPAEVKSDFSKKFKIPHTANNGRFFKDAFNVNGITFDITRKVDAYILSNGTHFKDGNIRLLSINHFGNDRNIEYEIIFMGEVNNLSSKIGGGFLNELDLSELSHQVTLQALRSSWNQDLKNGKIIYGLIEWGYDYNEDNIPSYLTSTISDGFSNSSGLITNYSGSFTNQNYPYWWEQMKPQIQAKAIFDKILSDAGFTYISSLLGTNDSNLESTYPSQDRFKNLYIISDIEDRALFSSSANFHAYNSTQYRVLANSNQTIICDREYYDYAKVHNSETGIYTAQSSQLHTFDVTGTFFVIPNECYPLLSDCDHYLYIVDADTNLVLGTAHEAGLVKQQTIIDTSIVVNLAVGQRVKLVAKSTVPAPYPSCSLSGLPEAKYYGNTFRCDDSGNFLNLASLLPNDIKKIDFVKSIITKFNLVMVPDPNVRNQFIITPWTTWIDEGTTIDWTNKLDSSKSLSIQPLFDNQSRTLIFKDQSDSDYLNDEYSKSNDDKVFGQLTIDSNNELLIGTTTIDTIFSPLMLDTIGWKSGSSSNAKKFIVPHVCKDSGASEGTDAGKREPIIPKIRLAYWNGYDSVSTALTWYLASDNQGTGTPITMSKVPMFSNYTNYPPQEGSFDLNWKNTKPVFDIESANIDTWNTNSTAYTEYWKKWYDLVYDPYSRKVEAYFILDEEDIRNLRYNNYYYVRDEWYFVNKVSDYVLGSISSCKVELIKVGSNFSVPLAEPSMYTSIELAMAPKVCTAYCCSQNPNCATFNTYYIDGTNLNDSNNIYLDPYGITYATPNYYSDGTYEVLVGTFGDIIFSVNPATCNCGTFTTQAYDVLRANNPCDTIVSGIPMTVYASPSGDIFLDSNDLWLDSGSTIPAPIGYYRESTNASEAIEIGNNGKNISYIKLDDCVDEFYYQYETQYSTSSACNAYCSNIIETVYSKESTFSASSNLYIDNTGSTLAPIGYYRLGNYIAHVTPAGNIDSFILTNTCSQCTGDVSITISIIIDIDNYETSGELFVSKDGNSWISYGSLRVNETNPSMSPETQTFTVDNNLYAKVVFTSNEPSATMTSGLYVSNASGFILSSNEVERSSPNTYELVFPSRVSESFEYLASLVMSGGVSGSVTYTELDLYYEESKAQPCIPFCHTNLTSSTYYGDNQTLATSAYLYDGPSGIIFADEGWYSNGVVSRYVGNNGAILESYDVSLCNCDSIETKVYPYKVKYHATSACDVCCNGVETVVYAIEDVWSEVSVLFEYGASGLEAADIGYYSLNDKEYHQINSNGVVIDTGDCVDDCSCTVTYATYRIVNKSLIAISYNYTSQSDTYYEGKLKPDEYFDSECMDLSLLNVDGYVEVTLLTSC